MPPRRQTIYHRIYCMRLLVFSELLGTLCDKLHTPPGENSPQTLQQYYQVSIYGLLSETGLVSRLIFSLTISSLGFYLLGYCLPSFPNESTLTFSGWVIDDVSHLNTQNASLMWDDKSLRSIQPRIFHHGKIHRYSRNALQSLFNYWMGNSVYDDLLR